MTSDASITSVGAIPSIELIEAMGRYNKELVDAGIMQSGDGIKPSSQGKRVAFDGDDRTVIDGPFPAIGENNWSRDSGCGR